MKGIPLITIVLIVNNWYLTYLSESLAAWHQKLFTIPGVSREFITAHTQLLRNWKLDILGLSVLVLVLIIFIWKNRLCNRWLAGLITAMWLLILLMPLTRLS